MPKKKKLFPYEALRENADKVMRLAKKENVRAALVGGLALQLLGSPRLTGDIDFVSEAKLEALPRVGSLSFGGYKSEIGGIPVDWILRNDHYEALYNEALDHAKTIEDEDGFKILAVLPEYLAAMKMAAGRASDNADLEWLIVNDVLDVKTTKRIVKKHLGPYAADELSQTIQIAKWRYKRELSREEE